MSPGAKALDDGKQLPSWISIVFLYRDRHPRVISYRLLLTVEELEQYVGNRVGRRIDLYSYPQVHIEVYEQWGTSERLYLSFE